MKERLGTQQKQIILFFNSKPDKRATRKEVYNYFIEKGVIDESQTEKIRRSIRRLLNLKILIIPKTKDHKCNRV